MILKRGRQDDDDDDDDDEDDDEEEDDREYVLFQGALNGVNPDMAANARLLQVALRPAKQLITDAIERRAEMIRVEPKGPAAQVAIFIDGIPYPGQRLPSQMAMAITQLLKLLSGMDPKERTKPQSGGMNAQFEERKFEVRIDTAPLDKGAERLIVRMHDKAIKLEKPHEIGFSEDLKEKIRNYTSKKRGLFLAAGPPNSGVSTVVIGIIRSVDAYLYSIYTLADMKGRDLSHVAVMEHRPQDNLLETITRAQRKDADVIYIDPISSSEMAKYALDGSELAAIIAELPAQDAADAIVRLCQLVNDPKTVAERLKIVCCQKLIRVLCPKCKQAYRPNPKLLAKIGLPPETKVLYRAPRPGEDEDEDDDEEPEVCRRCSGTGYLGRTAMIEMVEMTEAMQAIVAKGGNADAIRAQARQEKMQSFQSDGLRLIVEGKTSLEELQRVFRGK